MTAAPAMPAPATTTATAAMAEIARLRALLQSIAVQTDPQWGQQLAMIEVGDARAQMPRVRRRLRRGSVMGAVAKLVGDHPFGISKQSVWLKATQDLGLKVSEHTIRNALATLGRTKRIENRNRLWFPLDARLLEAGLLETQPREARLRVARSRQARSCQARLLESTPLDARPLGTRPVDAGSVDAGSVDTGPLGMRSRGAQPFGTESLHARPVDARPLESMSLDPWLVAP